MGDGGERLGLWGRTALVATLRELDDEGVRLLSITGPPGVGKTALLRAHARAAGEGSAWSRGTRTDLLGARDEGEVLRRLAASLHLEPVHAMDALIESIDVALRARGPTVHVLDGADDAGDALRVLVPRFLDASPESRFVVASRARTSLPGERVLDVSPLAPDDATELMVALAKRARTGWEPSAEERRDLARLAQRAGGVPLAIELAARWLDLMTPAEVLTRLVSLDDTAAARVGGPLYEALASAWRGLSAHAREAFAQCSVFAGAFDVEAAEAVVRLGEDGASVVEALDQLRRRSLLQAVHRGGSVRLSMAVPFRQYARGQLVRSGGVDEAKRRHAAWFARLCGDQLSRWNREGHERYWQALHDEAPELRAVVARFVRADDPELRAHAAQALLALEPVYVNTSVAGGAEWLDAAIDGCTDDRLRMQLLRMRGLMRHYAGKPDAAIADLEPVVVFAARSADAWLEGEARFALGSMRAHGRDESADSLIRARELFAEAGAERLAAAALDQLGLLRVEQGRASEARELFLEAAERARALGDRYQAAYLAHLAWAALESNLLDEAREWLDAAEAQRSPTYPVTRVTVPLRGYLSHLRGELDEAARHYERASELAGTAGITRYEALYRGYLGMVRRERGEVVAAVRDLERAREGLRARDAEHAALFTAVLGALRADQGAIDEATRRFRDARALLGSDASGSFVTSVSVLGAHLDLARGDRAAAEKRIEDAWWSAERRSIDVRLVLRAAPETLRAVAEQPGVPAPPTLVVHRTGQWMRLPGGDVVSLSKKRVGRRLVVELALARTEAPGEPVPAERLFERAWEGERVMADAAKNRLHVALSALRKQGLRDFLEAAGDGYRLARELRVIWTDEPE